MSVTPSSVAAAALCSAAEQPGQAGARLLLQELCGIPPAKIFAALSSGFDTDVAIAIGSGNFSARGITLNSGRVLIPYLVTSGVSGENSGSREFAATLRTQFLDGAEERVLLILDERPVETVLSATADAQQLPQLSWEALAVRAAQMAADEGAVSVPGIVDAVVKAFARLREPGKSALEDLVGWLPQALPPASDEVVGRDLWKLGCFLSDPEARNDTRKRLEQSAKLRAELDERYESRSKPWDREVRRFLARKRVAAEVADRVVAAAGPFGIRYDEFTLGDLLRPDGPAEPLRTDPFNPVADARTSIRDGDSLVVWLRPVAGRLQLVLQRPASSSDSGVVHWAGAGAAELELSPGQAAASVELPDHLAGWAFGTLEIRSGAAGDAAAVSETVQLAVSRLDGDWFPVEDGLNVDAAVPAFVCDDEPAVIAFGEGGEALGRATYPTGEEASEEAYDLTVEFAGGKAAIPVLVLGEGEDDSSQDGEGGEGDGDGGGEPEAPPAEYPSIPHALLHAGTDSWPQTRLDEDEGAARVTFSIGARQMHVSPQRAGGIDAPALEREILNRPEWTGYVWAPQDGSVSRAAGHGIAGLDEPSATRFIEARSALFEIAQKSGGIYAVDPCSAEVTEYIEAFSALLGAVPKGGRYQSDWDGLLLCDSVFIGGREDFLIAPTSPLAVAFHAGLSAKVGEWIGAGEAPAAQDIRSLDMGQVLPMLHARGQWYEAAPVPELLWRRYVPLAPDAPGAPDRNAAFIAQRLRFFLDVHPTYEHPDQVLGAAFYQPGDGHAVFEALRSFYRKERRKEHYTLPRLQVFLVGASERIEAEVTRLLAGGRADDLDLLVQSRVTIASVPLDQPPAFAHVTFLFRSPGERSARQVPMGDRPPTDYVEGLASAPGRKVYSDRHKVFAWGTWAPEREGCGCYQRILSRSLELVAGQPTGILTPGWTQMASASLDESELKELYRERSAWVVHLDRLIGIEAFGGSKQLIEYEERADPELPGYDGITATEQLEPYLEAVGRALNHLGEPGEDALRRLLQLLNSVSGRWALELLQRADNDILQRIGTVASIAALESLDSCIGTHEDGTAVLIALDEMVSRKPHRGVPRFSIPVEQPEGRMCDDLLILWVPRDTGPDPVQVRGAVVEVKYTGAGAPRNDEARAEIARTRDWLHEAFNATGASRPFRARDLAELITAAAARAGTFDLGRPVDPEALDPALTRIAQGDYELDLTHWRDGEPRAGAVISVEAESSVGTSQGVLTGLGGTVDLLRIGRPVLRQLVAGATVRADGRWAQISFVPPEPAAGGAPEPSSPPGPPAPTPERPEEPSAGEATAPGTMPEPEVSAAAIPEAEIIQLAGALDAAMQKYRLATEPFQPGLAEIGPSVIRLRTRALGPLSIADVERRARDIGREIGAASGVIVSQEPRFICIDVPRTERQPVHYRDVAAAGAAEAAAPGALSFIVGVAPSGEVRVADLARLPHLLVAGATGSGKSVFLRALLCHVVRTRGPGSLQILLIDPKQLDFAGFAGLPHLVGGSIISDPATAVEALRGTIEAELERRKPVLIGAGVTSATEFYESGGTYEELPQMLVLVDEFADLASVMDRQQRKGFQDLIQRYAQLTRAFGIYLVLATQRPSVDVITGSIKANLTARIAFGLPSHRDSMTVLDRTGAEDLLGNGDMLFYVNGQVERLQAPLVNASDIAAAAERWRGTGSAEG
jgi:hypothetical protein